MAPYLPTFELRHCIIVFTAGARDVRQEKVLWYFMVFDFNLFPYFTMKTLPKYKKKILITSLVSLPWCNFFL